MHDVVVVADSDLPDGHDWVFVNVDGHLRFCVKQSACRAEAFAEGWAAARLMRRLGDNKPRPALRCAS